MNKTGSGASSEFGPNEDTNPQSCISSNVNISSSFQSNVYRLIVHSCIALATAGRCSVSQCPESIVLFKRDVLARKEDVFRRERVKHIFQLWVGTFDATSGEKATLMPVSLMCARLDLAGCSQRKKNSLLRCFTKS